MKVKNIVIKNVYKFEKLQKSRYRCKKKPCLANQLYKVHEKIHRARSITAIREGRSKMLIKKRNFEKKAVLQIRYLSRYIKNVIELGQL